MATEQKSNDKLEARFLESAQNSPELLSQHKKVTGGMTRTRFPPEPNGYLHIGHAKSMNMNFEGAFEKLGIAKDKRFVIFRYDDTNPEAESKEFIDALAENVAWMGWKPDLITYSSNYFTELHALAVKLIKKGLAYVCHQTKEEIETSREITRANLKEIFKGGKATGNPDSPWRNRSVAENLKLFDDMRKGKYAQGKATLRMKMDMNSPNPNMWDSVAYRIKYSAHPHCGDAWCIYPSYDYTHCIVDALEHIDYSICTLEFETRRESYFWLLQALDLYRPKVYEFARLNITYTVMSKRKIKYLVEQHIVRGWDDPRLPTLDGLARRGFTPEILNSFCREIGVTRTNSNQQLEKLEGVARKIFSSSCARVMAIKNPIKVVISNIKEGEKITKQVRNYAPSDARDSKRDVSLTKTVYIDRDDFRLDGGADADFWGLAPGKEVLLKYFFNFKCSEATTNANGEVEEIHGTIDLENKNKCKGAIQWVGEDHLKMEIRMYEPLFTVEDLAAPENKDKKWESFLNPNSETVFQNAMIEGSVNKIIRSSRAVGKDKAEIVSFQFERLGYFILDTDSYREGRKFPVFNLTVGLKSSKAADPSKVGGNKSRKSEQDALLKEKQAKMGLNPKDMFKGNKEYSAFNEDGLPTHDAAGTALSKSAMKKLKKDYEKQKKLFEKNKPK